MSNFEMQETPKGGFKRGICPEYISSNRGKMLGLRF